ncbi:MAG TPA: S8 family serine peptidase [Actinomycetota bacterium]|jgi:subtilisin family serine protease
MRARPRRVVLATALALLPFAVTGNDAWASGSAFHIRPGERSNLSAAQIRRLSRDATHRSIIVLKNQFAALPAKGGTAGLRADATRASQAHVIAELHAVEATHVIGFRLINAVAATISKAEAKRLRADPSVRAVVPDAVRSFGPLDDGSGAGGAAAPATTGAQVAVPAPTPSTTPSPPAPQAICPSNPAQPLVEPEAREVMNANAADQIVTGSGVKVGIIADGIDPNNPDLIRSGGQHVIFDYEDFSGFGLGAPTDGREAFLDAGTIASQGNQVYDLSGFVNPAHPLPAGCNIRIEGLAPGSSLAVLNVGGSNPGFFNSQVVQAIQWAVLHDHVDVLNESFGGLPFPDTRNDPAALADNAAIAAGVTVVASTGDAGPTNTIGSPASDPGVISVGGTTTYRVYRQTSRYGTQLSPGGWENNNITALSSAGTTQFGPGTMSVVAPGDRGWSLCSSDTSAFFGCADIDHGANPPPIWAAGGTSASAPETSATAALVIEAYRNTHHGATPSPGLVKRIIVGTATDLGAPAVHQGAGLVNSLKAVQLAESIQGGTGGPQGRTLLPSTSSLVASAAPGTGHTFSLQVTNEAGTSQTLHPTVTGNPTQLSVASGSVTLSSGSPTYIDGEGNTDHYALHTFSVPSGADYLNGDIAWNAQQIGGAAFETLFDPSGRVAAYSLLGSAQSGRGHVEVRTPQAGTWTAVIFTVSTAPYFGPVQFSFSTQQFHGVGTVSPSSVTVAPHGSATIHVTLTAGPTGDAGYDLHLGTGRPDDGSIPILLRSLVPLARNGGSFSGTLTGGGVTGNAGQSETFQFTVPGGKPSLNVHVALADANYQINGFLVDPNGQPLDVQSSASFNGNGSFLGFGRDLQFFRTSPSSGRWTLTLLVAGPIDGARVSEPFTSTISFGAPNVTATGLPNSPSVHLAPGTPVTATISITNTGSVEEFYFADPRLDGAVPQELLGSGVNDVPLPLSLFAQPNWLVPTHTRALVVGAEGTVPIVMDVVALNGGPDVLGLSFGNDSVAALGAPEVAPGFWFGIPEARGPFTTATTGTVDLAAVADANRFDSAVSSTSGDLWKQSVDATAPWTPLGLAPGQTGTITVTITPSASAHHVRGFIDVDTFNLASNSGDEVASIPYRYTVG